MNYAPNDLFPSNTDEYNLGTNVLDRQPVIDETDAQLKIFKERLGMTADTTATIELPQTESPDISPSRSTMEGHYYRDYSAPAVEKTTQNSKLSTKQKVAVASYIAGVLMLILAITLCSVAISGSFGSVLALQGAQSELASQISEINETLTEDNYLELLQKATELGYVPISSENSYSYTVLETRPAQNFQVQTNWFDSMCDWLGELFGG